MTLQMKALILSHVSTSVFHLSELHVVVLAYIGLCFVTSLRSGDRFIEEKTLLLAVRSFVFFSQLSAWLSVSHGAIPRNILYRYVQSKKSTMRFQAGWLVTQ